MKINYEKELNKEQFEAATTIDGPLLIIAGAGTGKTRTLVYRTAYMIEKGIDPAQIVMLTFTNKAAKEMKVRVSELLNDKKVSDEITASTFHSFCVTILRRYANLVGLNNGFTILSSTDVIDVINIQKTANSEKYNVKGFPPSSLIAKIISMAINKRKTIDEIMNEDMALKYGRFLNDVKEINAMAVNYKQKNSMLDYDDLLLYTYRLLCENPDVVKVLNARYKYIMVDEYQDTNDLQEKILFCLLGDGKNIAVVGDDLQSLYAFRGANVNNIIDFPKKVTGCKTIFLTKNYRSCQEILDVSNHVVLSATEGYKKNLTGFYNNYQLPILFRPYSQFDEAEQVVKYIKKQIQKGDNPEDICILIRSSNDSNMLEMELNKADITFVKYGGKKFFEMEHIQDILAYMRIVNRTDDELAWFRVLKVLSGIGDQYARKISLKCKKNGINELLSKDYNKKKYGKDLKQLYEVLKVVSKVSVSETYDIISRFYVKMREQNIKNMKTSEDKRTGYYLLLEKHKSDIQSMFPLVENYKNIANLLNDLIMDNSSIDNKNNETGCIKISTVHSSKGLEYDTVIMIDCIDQIFPSTDSSQIGTKEDNEELRCFYVAVTRAKKKLIISSPRNAKKYNQYIPGFPSHYLEGQEFLLNETSNII